MSKSRIFGITEDADRLYTVVEALTQAWLVQKAIDADKNVDIINGLAMGQHERVRRAIVELVDAGQKFDRINKKVRARRLATKRAGVR